MGSLGPLTLHSPANLLLVPHQTLGSVFSAHVHTSRRRDGHIGFGARDAQRHARFGKHLVCIQRVRRAIHDPRECELGVWRHALQRRTAHQMQTCYTGWTWNNSLISGVKHRVLECWDENWQTRGTDCRALSAGEIGCWRAIWGSSTSSGNSRASAKKGITCMR